MARIATSIEESKRLLELGIDSNTADMRWYREQKWFPYELQPYPYNESIITDGNESMKPAWSLGKLFDIAWELDPNQVLSFQKGEKMDLIAIMVDFIEMLVREVNTKGKEE